MHLITARNVSEALHIGLRHLRAYGKWQKTRTGDVLEYSDPVITEYSAPTERVLFYPERDANPFFHLFESIWMLAGRKDLEYLSLFNKRMKLYSDNGVNFNGAYGYRWKTYFKYDQLYMIINHLKTNPESRRAVLTMWDAEDLCRSLGDKASKDVPCNTHIYFKIRDNMLDMTVCCRSNDIIWGTYGANAVHFSILQEYMASHIGCLVGKYRHLSDSFHAYKKPFEKTLKILDNDHDFLWYDSYIGLKDNLSYKPEPMFSHPEKTDEDIHSFLFYTNNYFLSDGDFKIDVPVYTNTFFKETAERMFHAWYKGYIKKDYSTGIEDAEQIQALDWRKASVEWLKRRMLNKYKL